MGNKTGKIGVPTKSCLWNQTGKFPVEFSWKNWCACVGKEPRRRGPDEADLGLSGGVWFLTPLPWGIPVQSLWTALFSEGSLAQTKLGGPKPLLEPALHGQCNICSLLNQKPSIPAHVLNWISEKCKLLLQWLPFSCGAGGVFTFPELVK